MGFCRMRLVRRWLMFATAIIASPCCSASAQDRLASERGRLNESLTSLDYTLRLHKALLKEACGVRRNPTRLIVTL